MDYTQVHHRSIPLNCRPVHLNSWESLYVYAISEDISVFGGPSFIRSIQQSLTHCSIYQYDPWLLTERVP